MACMKKITEFIQEKLHISNYKKCLSYKDLISKIEDYLKEEIHNIKIDYIDINVVNDKYRNPDKGEWLQLSSGVYKKEANINAINYKIEELLKSLNIKFESKILIGETFSLINIYIKDKIINDTDE